MASAIQEKILFERTRLLYKNGTASNITVVIAVVVVSLILWGDLPDWQIVCWLGAMVIMVTVRSVLLYLHHRAPPEEVDARIWAVRYLIVTGALGFGWVAIVILGVSEDLFTRMLIVMLVIGIISAAVPVLGAFPLGLKIYILPPMLTCVIKLVSLNEFESNMLALALIIYTLMILRSANNFYDTLIASFQLQYENQELVEHLRIEKQNADALNSNLAGEIRDRKMIQKQLEAHQDGLEFLVEARTAELVSAKIEAEAGSRAKSNFLATMSHEIRTPLNGVLGMLELLIGTDMNEKQQHYAKTAYFSGNALLDLINNILDFSKIEANRVSLNRAPFNINKVVDSVRMIVSEQAQGKGLELQCNVRTEVACPLIGDEIRLRQILLNLIGNAVKFTEQGSVVVTVEVIDDGQDEVLVKFQVKDSGIGIAQDEIKNIFSEFTQVDHSSTRRFEGTGLGLAISQQLVNLMGGTIDVISKLGEGTIFQFAIKLEKDLTCRSLSHNESLESDTVRGEDVTKHYDYRVERSGARRRILLAEDNLVNLEVALAMLDNMSHETDAVSDGEQALNMALSNEYDLILLDCHMPGLSGFDVTEAIRRHELSVGKPRAPIIALTADVEAGILKRCKCAGMDGYLSKPFAQNELNSVVSQWAAGKARKGSSDTALKTNIE